MAEPTNTPMPPSTPVPAATPRSASPVPAMPGATPNASSAPLSHQGRPSSLAAASAKKLIVLHIGDPIKYNPATYESFSSAFDVIRPSHAERQRGAFKDALRTRRWGDFSAIFRPFWGSGGEMGRWDAELIDLLPPSVRVFASAGAGFDWADTRLMAEHGIIYCNSGLAAAEAVADFTVAMIISTFRQLPWCMSAATLPYFSSISGSSGAVAVNGSDRAAEEVFQACHINATASSHTLRGHVLGLIGLGNIGQHIAAKLGNPSFGMVIHYHDVERKPVAVESSLGATFHSDLDSLLRVSDCAVLCTPASRDGRPLITAATLAHLKPGARFVNIARGSLVDEAALAAALASGAISSAALDVHAYEPRVHPALVAMARPDADGGGGGRVMLTCHNAGGTVETHAGFEELSMRNIMAVLQGEKAITPVNLQWLKQEVAESE